MCINFLLFTGLTYTDKTVEGWPKVTEENEIVKINGFTDRVYAQAPDVITFQNAENVPQIKLTKSGLKDWVVWNPYETAANMSDMHEDGHFEFVCIEATQTSERIVLNPGQNWEASHSMEVL
jgi:D-hexose-6-phosphate mutarotase